MKLARFNVAILIAILIFVFAKSGLLEMVPGVSSYLADTSSESASTYLTAEVGAPISLFMSTVTAAAGVKKGFKLATYKYFIYLLFIFSFH
jgi:hypothetical protein